MHRSRVFGIDARWALLAAAGVVATVLAYGPAEEAGFYFDDDPNIVELPALHWTELSLDGLSVFGLTRHGRRPGEPNPSAPS